MRFFLGILIGMATVGCQPDPVPQAPTPVGTSNPAPMPSASAMSPMAPVLRLDPAYPCGDEVVTAVGEGFSAGKVTLEFKREDTRFGDGPTVRRDVSVGPDGRIHFEFRLSAPDFALFSPGGRRWLRAIDPAGGKVEVPIPTCNPELRTALEASTVSFEEVIRGEMTISEPRPGDDFETAVIHSQAELAAVLDKHGFLAAVDRIPPLDFDRQVGILSLVRPQFRWHRTEIVAMTPSETELTVRTVDWEMPSPLFQVAAFHYVAIPTTTRSIRFAPLAHGYSTQRDALKPELKAHRPPLLQRDDRTGDVRVTETNW